MWTYKADRARLGSRPGVHIVLMGDYDSFDASAYYHETQEQVTEAATSLGLGIHGPGLWVAAGVVWLVIVLAVWYLATAMAGWVAFAVEAWIAVDVGMRIFAVVRTGHLDTSELARQYAAVSDLLGGRLCMLRDYAVKLIT